MYKQRLILFVSVCLVASAAIIAFRPAGETALTTDGLTSAEFWGAKTHLGEGENDAVVVGDSRAVMGISPAAMRERLPGLDILNFGYLGAGLTPDLLDAALRKIDPNSENRMLVMSVTPRSLAKAALPNQHFKQESAKPRVTRPATLLTQKLDDAFRPFKPFERPKTAQQPYSGYAQPTDSGYREAGWLASSGPVAHPRIALASYTRHFSEGPFNEPNFERVLQTLSRASDDGIRIFAFRPPSSKKMEALENRLSGFREGRVRKRLAEVGVTWLTLRSRQGRKLDLPSYDGSHLTPAAAQRFSAILAREIAARR